MPLRRVIHLFFMCLVALACVSTPAFAQQDVEKRVRSMNKQAMKDYDSLEFEMARNTLMDAVSLIRQSGLDESPVAAKTYLDLGIVYAAGFKDRKRGVQQFVQALHINPSLQLDPQMATPELEEAFTAARKQAGGGGGDAPPKPTPPDETPDKPPAATEVKGLAHTQLEEARPGEPLIVKAQLGEDTGAVRVFLLYRSSGEADYITVPMRNTTGAEWAVIVPSESIGDRPLQYYLEARDKRGRAMVGSGSAQNPYIVTIAEEAPGARIVHDEPREPRRSSHGSSKFHHVFVFASLGTGFGFHPGGNGTEVAYVSVQNPNGSNLPNLYKRAAVSGSGGTAISPFHIAIEIGGNITSHFSLSALGRFEVVTGGNAQTQAEPGGVVSPSLVHPTAIAGFLRARYRFLEGRWHPYIHVDIGGGEVRNALKFGTGAGLVDLYTAGQWNSAVNNTHAAPTGLQLQTVCPATGTCADTLKLGDLFIGGGFGVTVDVWKYLALMLDVNILGAAAVGNGGQSGMQMDFSLGLGAHFL